MKHTPEIKQISGTYTKLPEGKSEINLEPSDLIRGYERDIVEVINRTLSNPTVVMAGETVNFKLRNFSIALMHKSPMLVLSQRNGHSPFNLQGLTDYAATHPDPEEEDHIRLGSPRQDSVCYLKHNRSLVEIYL